MAKRMDTATADEMAHWPTVKFISEQTRKHIRIVLTYDGETAIVTRSGTSSCTRAALNHVGDLRRACRKLGATRNGRI